MAIFVTLILLAATFVLSELLRPKPQIENAKPAGIGDFNFPTATQGRTVPLLWGTSVIKGPNVIWYGDLKQVPITEKVKTGMFSSEHVVVGYQYYIGMQFGLCRGEIDEITQVWIKDKLVFNGSATSSISINKPNLFGGDDMGYGGVVGTLTLRLGSQAQTAVSYLSAHQSVGGVTPAYPGTAHATFEQGYIGNTTSIDPWKFVARRIPNGLGLGTASVNGGNDANPMNVIYELMTNVEWGLAFPSADIDSTSFTAAATTLLSEGNGYSRLLDRQVEAKELLREIEEQIDGIVFLNQQTGKWEVTLVRDDYDVDLVPQVTESNLVEVSDFSRGAWSDTSNQVKVQFNNRSNRYAEDFALAQDMANAMAQGGGTTTTGKSILAPVNYPGVKNKTLANALAWRDLRSLSYPLAKATFTVDRSFWDVTPGSVVAWSDDDLGIIKMPMRVMNIDHGELQDNRMQLKCVQDVFQSPVGVFADPPDTSWTEIQDDLAAFPSDEQVVIEAPRALTYRDPLRSGDMVDKLWCGGRQQDNAVGFEIVERHATAPSSPSGAYSSAGKVYAMLLIGSLKNDLASGSGVPTTSIVIEADPDAQSALEAAFDDALDIVEQGVNLQNIIMIGEEFMLPRGASTSGADVSLDNVYRGVLDGGQDDHSAGDPVYLVFVGGGLIDGTVPDGQNVDVKLLPFSSTDQVAEGDATVAQLEMDDRLIRPYPPSSMDLNGSTFPSGTVSLDYLNGGAAEATGIDLDFLRRDFRTAEGEDEIAALLADAATLFSDFPSANSTVHNVGVYNDPDGSDTLILTYLSVSGASQDIKRIDILKATDGVLPTRMKIGIGSMHDAGGKTNLLSRNNLLFSFDVGSAALSGQFNFGALDASDVSNEYMADAAGTHAFTLSSAFTAGDVEYRIDTGGGYGSWTTLVTAGGTTGNVTSVAVGDKIEIRHLSSDVGALKQIDMTAPGAGTDAYGILFT